MSEMFLQSFIDVDLWNSAGWSGVIYLIHPDPSAPPCIGLLFKSEEAAKTVFRGWRDRLSPEDKYEELRVAIVEGDIPGREPGYSVHINSNPERTISRAKQEGQLTDCDQFVTIGRVHRMNPEPTSKWLANFKSAYNRVGRYLLIPAVIDPTLSPQVRPIIDLAIGKKEIFFRDVVDITEHDLDVVVFSKEEAERRFTRH